MRWIRPVLLVVLVGVIVLGWWFAESREERRRDTLSGIVETRQIAIGSKTAGRVAEVFVREGDEVRPGSRILRFEDEELEAQARSAEAAVEAARANLDLLEAGARSEQIAQLRAAAAAAQATYDKLRRGSRPEEIAEARAAYRQAQAGLSKLRAGSRPEEIEAAKAAYDAAEAEYLKLVAGPRPEEIARARAALDAAKAERDRAERDETRFRDLYAQGAISRQRLDEAVTRAETARAAEDSAAQALGQLMRGTREEDLVAARAQMERARQALLLAQAGPRKEDIDAATRLVEQAKARLDVALSGPRREDVEAARQAYERAKAALEEAENGARPEEIEAAAAAVEQAEAALAAAREQRDESIVVAPTAGRVQMMNLRAGDLVSPGQPIAVIQPPDDLWVNVYVPEDRLGRVRVGQEVRVRVDSFPNDTFRGVVEFISTKAEFTPRNVQTPAERVNQVFAVRVRLRDPSGRLRAGMSADIRLSEVAPE